MIKNHKLAKSIQDAAWGEFIRQLKYKSIWYGRDFYQIDTYFASSKTCSECNYKLEKLDLSTRVWICPNCFYEHDRDINAAINILKEGIRCLFEEFKTDIKPITPKKKNRFKRATVSKETKAINKQKLEETSTSANSLY
jgi:putative transposase